MHDAIIVGGGPAGLSAALVLGRCRRHVLVIDDGAPRNASSRAIHNILSRDGIAPQEFLRISWRQLAPFNVQIVKGKVVAAASAKRGFRVTLRDRSTYRARKLLLATGVVDVLPSIPGLQDLYGICVHHCPYCDAWQWRDRPIAVLGHGRSGADLAATLTAWSRDIVLCTNGSSHLRASSKRALRKLAIRLIEHPIQRLRAKSGRLRAIEFLGGDHVDRDCLFFSAGQIQRSTLASELGCELTRDGSVKTPEAALSTVRGVFVAGDVARGVQFVVQAASEGAVAAVRIHQELQHDDGLQV
jgi:thioredoxin reductase